MLIVRRTWPFACFGLLVLLATPTFAADLIRLPLVISEPGEYDIAQDLTFTGRTGSAITVTASDVTLRFNGHRLIGPSAPHPGPDGIRVQGASRVIIDGAQVSGFRIGIWLNLANNCTVSGNTLGGNEEGIYVRQGRRNTLRGNRTAGGEVGIEVQGPYHVLDENVARDSRYAGIVLVYAEGARLTGNTATGHGFSGIELEYSLGTLATGNETSGNLLGIAALIGSTGNRFLDNFSHNNRRFDLFDGNPGGGANLWRRNRFDTDNEPGNAAGPGHGSIR